jgi:putative ABC transport system substrate-binding protein
MRRRDFVLISAATLVLPDVLNAQKKMPVIGLLWNDSVKPSPYVAVLVAAMRDKGYVLDRDFRLEDRVTLEGYGGYAEGATDLVKAKVDLILTNGATSATAVAKATKDIPIVMIIGSDPVRSGLVRSLGRPGGNITGVLTLSAGLNARRIAILKELNPRLTDVGVLFASNVANAANMRESEAAAERLKVQLHFAQVGGPQEFEGAVTNLVKKHVGAMYVGPSTMLAAHAAPLVEIITRQRIAAVFSHERFAETTALMTYAGSTRKAFMRAVSYVERILKGARAGELAIDQAGDLLELTVNLKTAKELGIALPQAILLRADRVIQ